jgi:hypothetical protein
MGIIQSLDVKKLCRSDQFLFISIVRQEFFPVWDAAAFIYSCLRATFSFTLHANEQLGKSSVKGRIIIKCSDTDVLVLSVHYYPRMHNTDQL